MKIDVKDKHSNDAVRAVYLNGKRLRNCVAANDQLGTATVLYEEDGKVVHNKAGEPMLRDLKGKVEIELWPDWECIGGELRPAS